MRAVPKNRISSSRPLSLRAAVALAVLLLSAAAVIFFYLDPLKTGDARLDGLADAVIPRFFLTAFLLVPAYELFPECLACRNVPLKRLLWCVLPLGVALVNFPFSALLGGDAKLLRADLIPLFFAKCLLIGLSEEVLFRGIVFSSLLDRFEQAGRSCFYPVLLSSVIFALFHFVNLLDGAGILAVLQQAGYSFLIGAMLAVTLFQTKNLWICVSLHTLFDCGGLLLSDLGTGNPHDLIFWILTAAAGALCAVQVVITLIKEIKKVR